MKRYCKVKSFPWRKVSLVYRSVANLLSKADCMSSGTFTDEGMGTIATLDTVRLVTGAVITMVRPPPHPVRTMNAKDRRSIFPDRISSPQFAGTIVGHTSPARPQA